MKTAESRRSQVSGGEINGLTIAWSGKPDISKMQEDKCGSWADGEEKMERKIGEKHWTKIIRRTTRKDNKYNNGCNNGYDKREQQVQQREQQRKRRFPRKLANETPEK